MATLPDIDTDEVSFLAYWNAIDQGEVDSINPEEALEDGSIIEYTLYDNGWEGTYNSTVDREIEVRVKNDGWFVAYMDREENYATNETDRDLLIGWWDISNDWRTDDSSITKNTLERAIYSLVSNLDNYDDMVYDEGEVGLYDYMHSGSTTLTHFSAEDSDGGDNTWHYGFSYTQDTDIQSAVVAGWGENSQYGQGNVYFEGNDVSSSTEVDSDCYGVYNIVDELESAGKEYRVEHESVDLDPNVVGGSSAHSLIIEWS